MIENVGVTVDGNGNKWVARHAVTGQEGFNQGILNVMIKDYIDEAGNIGEEVIRQVIMYDDIKPSISITENIIEDIIEPQDIVYEVSYSDTNFKSIDLSRIELIKDDTLYAELILTEYNGRVEAKVTNIAGYGKVNVIVQDNFVKDQAGNVSSKLIGKEFTISRVTQAIAITKVESNNPNGKKVAKLGDSITIEFVANIDLNEMPTLTIGQQQVIVERIGNRNYKATYVTSENDITGNLTFKVEWTDLEGNQLEISDSSIYFRKTGPSIDLNITTTNQSENKVKVGDIISIKISTDTSLLNLPEVTIEMGEVIKTLTAVDNQDGTYTANYTILDTDSEGIIKITTNLTDITGNSESKENTNIEFLKTLPIVTGVANNTITNQDLIVSFDKGLATLNDLSFTSGSIVNLEGNYILVVKDEAGNTTTINFIIHKTGPTGGILINGGGVKTNSSNVVLSLSAISEYGVEKLRLSNDGINWYEEDYVLQKIYTLPGGNGVKTIYVQYKDNIGNWGEIYNASIDLNINLPILNIVSISSDNVINNQYATNGSTITLTIQSDKNLEVLPKVTIGARAAFVTGSGNSFTATYTIPTNENMLFSGILTITISEFVDEYGNAGETVLNTTDGSQITYDKIAATMTTIDIKSNNAISTWYAEIGDTITLTFISNKKIYNPQVEIAGHIVAATEETNNTWTANYTLQEGDKEGTIQFKISNYWDNIGTVGEAKVTTTNGSSVYLGGKDPFITTWKTSVANGKIVLPLIGTDYNMIVDWGDGSIENIRTASAGFHIYAKAGEYVIKIYGYCPTWDFFGATTSYKHNIIQINSWGTVGFNKINFRDCSNLVGPIPSPSLNSFAKTENMAYLFYGCTSLTGSIPEDLFANATKVITLHSVFRECNKLTGSIPENLFENVPLVTSFSCAFINCRGLTGDIPENLFKNTIEVKNFELAFYNCSGLTGSISESLFKNTEKVTTFERIFYNCTGLTGNIPEGLFVNTPLVTTFYGTFFGCTGLSGDIPENLFASAKLVKSFSYVFYECSGLTGSIPNNLFANSPLVTNFSYTFGNCTSLEGEAPSLWERSNVTLSNKCFTNCYGLSNFELIPNDWK